MHTMTQREYESRLKDIIEGLVRTVMNIDEELLYGWFMPQNVAGTAPIDLLDWVDAREKKRSR